MVDPWCEKARTRDTGFHTLIREPDQVGAMGPRCDCVRDNLERLIQNTRSAAPLRDRGFCLLRDSSGTPRAEEARWERAMWRRWGPHADGASFLPMCPHLQTFQYPLKCVRDDLRWGKIDLLGVSPDFGPVVVELKREGSNETVLRMLLEMVAYGIALRSVWPNLRPHWQRAMRTSWSHTAPAPAELGRVTLIGTAPPGYWTRAQRTTDAKNVRQSFCDLVTEISHRCDFSIYFARVEEDSCRTEDGGRLPNNDSGSLFVGHPHPERGAVIALCPQA